MIDATEVRQRLNSRDHRRILRQCGFDINGERGPELSGVLGPKALGEGEEGNFSVDLEQGLVKDWGSSGYQGDVFDVVQDVLGLGFSETLEWIADELNLDLSSNGDSSGSASAEAGTTEPIGSPGPETAASHEQARRWHERLMSEGRAAQAARSYLIEARSVSGDVLTAAQIGLAHSPDDHRATWWIMIPVPKRGAGDPPPIVSVKGFAFAPKAEGWKRGSDGRKIPRNAGSAALYDLVPSVPTDAPVVVCEGELDALCALSHGFNAVTGTAGASTFKKGWAEHVAALSPAEEHGVIVAFDGDEAGQKGAQDAAKLLRNAGADVRVASLPDGKDVNDVLLEGGREFLHSILEDAKPYPSTEAEPTETPSTEVQPGDEEGPEYEPFPLGVLPGPVQKYVRSSARALGEDIPPAMVAVPTLSVLSGAIGDAVRLELKRSWTEPATLWTMLVAPSGSTKSPAFQHAVRPVFRLESEALDRFERALAEWEAQEEPDERDKPTRDRYRTGDATPEAVVKILEENPRGVLLARDELGAWIGSFDRYTNGAADLQFWVEVWQGTQASRDRAGEGNTTVDTPAVPVTGTIQPNTLKEKLDDIHFDTGFAGRLIPCMPPSPPKRWTEADVTREVREGYSRVLSRLYSTARHQQVTLTSEAKRKWVDYYNDANASLDIRSDGPAKAVAAKGITHTARLALILHQTRKAVGQAESEEVGRTAMEAAIQIGQWLVAETLRVYHELGLDAEALSPMRRFFDQLPDQFETSEAKQVAKADEIPERTMYDWLDKLQETGDLKRVKRGHYRKT